MAHFPKFLRLLLTLLALQFLNLETARAEENVEPRFVLFVGVDISGSFLRGRYFKDSIHFLANYLYGHVNGLGDMEQAQYLFVGSIGGAKPGEPKTFFPIETFQNKNVKEIEVELNSIFPRNKENPITDFNAFFVQISEFVRNRNLSMRPIGVVMLSDGFPSLNPSDKKPDFKSITLEPLENLSRNVTLRVLYTKADIAMGWATLVPRNRVKVWSQDDRVMSTWKDPKIFLPKTKFDKQERFFSWLKNNVDFPVQSRTVK